MKLVDLPPGSDAEPADDRRARLDAYLNEFDAPQPLTLVSADVLAPEPDEWAGAPLPWEAEPRPAAPTDRHADVAPDAHARRLALGALFGVRPRLLLTSGGVGFVLPRSAPRTDARPVRAALGLLDAEALVLAEAQAFLDRVSGVSVWDFFETWAWDVDGEPSHVETAFCFVWLYCVAMQGRGAFPPVAYLRRLGYVMPAGARTIDDLEADADALRSAGDFSAACQLGWNGLVGYGENVAGRLPAVWEALGGADVSALASRSAETPDAHDMTG